MPTPSEQVHGAIPVGTAIFAYFPPHQPFPAGYYRVYKVADLPAPVPAAVPAVVPAAFPAAGDDSDGAEIID